MLRILPNKVTLGEYIVIDKYSTLLNTQNIIAAYNFL